MEPRENLFGFAPESISRAKKREVEREDDLAQRIHGEKKNRPPKQRWPYNHAKSSHRAKKIVDEPVV